MPHAMIFEIKCTPASVSILRVTVNKLTTKPKSQSTKYLQISMIIQNNVECWIPEY